MIALRRIFFSFVFLSLAVFLLVRLMLISYFINRFHATRLQRARSLTLTCVHFFLLSLLSNFAMMTIIWLLFHRALLLSSPSNMSTQHFIEIIWIKNEIMGNRIISILFVKNCDEIAKNERTNNNTKTEAGKPTTIPKNWHNCNHCDY